MTKLRPLGCRIIVKVEPEVLEEGYIRKSDGKLYHEATDIQVPDTTAENYERMAMIGEIIATGTAMDPDWNLQVGDTVLFGRHAGDWVPDRMDGYEDCRMMAEDDVVCVIEEDGN